MIAARVSTLLAVVVLLAGCGNAAGSELDAEGSGGSAAASPTAPTGAPTGGSATPTPTPTPSDGSTGAYTPGEPDNQVLPATAQQARTWRTCEEVWQRDGRIPGRYRGCLDGDAAVVADRIDCSFGGSMTTYDDRYYGVLGNVVNDAGESLATSRRYADAFRLCSG